MLSKPGFTLKSGYPSQVLTKGVGFLIKKVKGGENIRRDVNKKRMVIIPYLHKICHNHKQVANRYGVRLVLSVLKR